jgi:hypothetical protein
MSEKDYEPTLRNIPEECGSHPHHSGSLKSWMYKIITSLRDDIKIIYIKQM